MKCLEERDRLEEENEKIEEGKGEEEGKVLSEEEIDEKIEELRGKLTREFEDEGKGGRERVGGLPRRGAKDEKGREKRQFKAHQVHELAEAKIEESERLRKALGIKEGFGEGDEQDRGGRFDGRGKERERW